MLLLHEVVGSYLPMKSCHELGTRAPLGVCPILDDSTRHEFTERLPQRGTLGSSSSSSSISGSEMGNWNSPLALRGRSNFTKDRVLLSRLLIDRYRTSS